MSKVVMVMIELTSLLNQELTQSWLSPAKLANPIAVTVEVVAVANVRMQLILVKTKNGYLDFYYNGNEQLFKHFTEEGYHLWDQWSEENAENVIESLGLKNAVSDNWDALY